MEKTFVGTDESAKAVMWICSVNKSFRKIAKISQKNNKFSGLDICNLVKK